MIHMEAIQPYQVRAALQRHLPTDADFEGFCIDYFPDVQKRFSSGMNRLQKENLLLEMVEASIIHEHLLRKSYSIQSIRANVSSRISKKVFAGVLGLIAGLAGLHAWRNPIKTPLDYASFIERRRGSCDSSNSRFTKNDNNIIQSGFYAARNMAPEPYYADEGDRAIVNPEPAAGGTFYRIQTTEHGFKNKGGNYGGFKYELDRARTPIHKKYRISFCAWSVTQERIGLRIHHTAGSGGVSSLTRIALLSKDHDRFEWEAPLEWVQQSEDAPHQSLFGYLVDPITSEGYDLHAMNRFSKQEFVIGDFKLEVID